MASKVGMVVTYTPTEAENPMLAGQPQAAVITGWDEETEKADLCVFTKRAGYVTAKTGAVEGTVAGTFQQLAAAPPSTHSTAHETSTHKKA